MKYRLIILVLLLSINIPHAQKILPIVPFEIDGKWGFMNKDKEIIVKPKYQEAYPSIMNRLRVKINGKYGFIDYSGEMVIKPKYSAASDFGRTGTARVSYKGTWFDINSKGKENLIPIGICGTHYSCSKVRISKKITIYKKENKLGLVHDKWFKNEGESAYYLPDTIAPIFDSIGPLPSGMLYLVKDSLIAIVHQGDFYAGGNYILERLLFEYQGVQLFSCHYCSDGIDNIIGIKINNLWGFAKIFYECEQIIEPKYLSIVKWGMKYLYVEYEKDIFGYIDLKGNEYFIRTGKLVPH